MIPHATIEHQLARRIRLKIPAKRNDDRYFAEVSAFFYNQPGTEKIRTKAAAASIVLEHSGNFEEIAARAAGEGVFKIEPRMPQPNSQPPNRRLTPAQASASDQGAYRAGAFILAALGIYQASVARNFGYAVDNFWNAYGARTLLRNPLLAALLVAIGLRQLTRGRLFGSATSLLFYAIYSHRMAQEHLTQKEARGA
jgi:hypothetical protein